MGLQPVSWAANILRTIVAMLDSVVYRLVRLVVMGIFDVAELTTASGLLSDVYTRIYVLLGVFMAFKLSFSFIQYVINPDSMSEKNEKGVNKLIINTIIMLIALVTLPGILFGNGEGGGLLKRAQDAFLPMLPRVILGISEDSGVSVGNGNNTDDVAKSADTITVTALRAFFSPPEEIDDYCGSGTYNDTPQINSIDEFYGNVNVSCRNKSGEGGSPKYYRYSYLMGVSTIVGGLIVFMFLGIGIDVGKRVFKMLILELVAPIPIMSLIDPKSSKDGAFANWVKTLVSTFIDIFLKIGLLYLVLVLLNMITSKELFANSPSLENQPVRNAVLYIFLIIGLIFFVREAPKFIKGAFGIKDNGEKSAMGTFTGLAAGGLAGAATGAVSGLISGRGLRGALTGAATGLSSGVSAAGTGKPSGAWKNAGDAAGQVRTGDKNYKSGIANALIRGATKSQAASMGRRLNLTEGTIDAADKHALALESAAEQAKEAYDRELAKGNSADQALLDNLSTDYYNKKSVADSARRNADKAKEDYKALGLGRSGIEKRKLARRNNSYVAKTANSVRNSARSAMDNVERSVLGDEYISHRSARRQAASNLDVARSAMRTGFDPLNRDDTQLQQDAERYRNEKANEREQMRNTIFRDPNNP